MVNVSLELYKSFTAYKILLSHKAIKDLSALCLIKHVKKKKKKPEKYKSFDGHTVCHVSRYNGSVQGKAE